MITQAFTPIYYDVLDKLQIIDVDRQQLLDFTQKIFADGDISEIGAMYVPPYCDGKVNLFSHICYNDQNCADFLMHYNEISNPFMFGKNHTISLPLISDMQQLSQSQSTENKSVNVENIANKSMQELKKKISEKDQKRIIQLQQQAGNTSGKITTPNMTTDPQEVIFDDRVIFGTNVSNCECDDGLTSVETKSKKIKDELEKMFLQGNAPSGGDITLGSSNSTTVQILQR